MPPTRPWCARLLDRRNRVAAALFSLIFSLTPSWAGPKIWIFNGDPGDELHHEKFEKNLAALKKSFTGTYAIPEKDVKIFYGPKEAGYDGICSKENVLAELKEAVAATKDKDCTTVWIILLGHANSIPGSSLFNLPGPDLSPREFAEALKEAAADKPLVFINTTTASEPYVKALAAPSRFVITANSRGDAETETDYPQALTTALAEHATSDANKDGFLSVAELFQAAHAKLETTLTAGGYVIQEHSQLDGNGDGQATRRPAAIDGEPASTVGLRVGGGSAGPGKPALPFD